MGMMIIATLYNGEQLVGVRLLDVQNRKSSIKDVPIGSVINVLKNEPNIIDNFTAVDNELIGTNGKIDRYAKFDLGFKALVGKSPLVVINQLEDVGYTVSDFKGEIRRIKTSEAVEYSKNNGIANGKVVTNESGKEYISAIRGEYVKGKIVKSKLGEHTALDMGNLLQTGGTDYNSIKRNTKTVVTNTLNTADVFYSMTPEQKKVIQAFYVWLTVKIFNGITKHSRLDIAPGKVERLTAIRGDYGWQFAGIIDKGFQGGGKCELGHSLRYVYYAKPVDEHGHEVEGVRYIAFGETCAGDFFDISKEDMKQLIRLRMNMSKEIIEMTDIANDNGYEKYTKSVVFVNSLLEDVSTAKLEMLMGKDVHNWLETFRKFSIAYPESLLRLVSEELMNRTSDVFRAIPDCSTEACSRIYKFFVENMHRIKDEKHTGRYDAVSTAAEAMWHCIFVKVRGPYGYDPLKETGKEKGLHFNKESRGFRLSLLSRLRSEDFDVENANVEGLRELFRRYDKCMEDHEDHMKKISTVLFKNEDNKYKTTDDMVKKFNEIKEFRWGLGNYISQHGEQVSTYIINGALDLVMDEIRFETGRHTVSSYLRKQIGGMVGALQILEKLVDFADSEIERLEKERLDREAREARLREEEERRRQEVLQRLEERKRAEKEESTREIESESEKTENTSNGDLVDVFKDLIEQNKDADMDSINIMIANDIQSRGLKEKELSSRQLYRVKEAIKELGGTVEEKDVKSIANNRYNLDDREDIKKKIDRINLMMQDKEVAEAVESEDPIVKSIIRTVQAKGVITDRQIKHIESAYKIAKNNLF